MTDDKIQIPGFVTVSTTEKFEVSGVSPANIRQSKETGYITEPIPVSHKSWNEINTYEYAKHLCRSGYDSVVVKRIIAQLVAVNEINAYEYAKHLCRSGYDSVVVKRIIAQSVRLETN